MKRARFIPLFALLLVLLIGHSVSPAHAQSSIQTRFGIAMNMALSVDNGFGLGFRGRVSSPINTDFSLAIGMGFTGFVLRGRDDATFVFDPQLSGIINLPSTSPDAEIYLLAGLGAYVPISQNAGSNESGPSIHFGIGRVQLLQESSFFYEINPAVIVGETTVQFVLPFRVGLIFGN
jgi:hypothetical protein